MAKNFKLTAANYYSKEANERYFSVSQYKTFLDCPARAMAEIRGEYKQPMTTALLVGSYVDSYFEGTLEQFCEEHPEIFKKNGELKADYIKAEEIIKRVEEDELFTEFMKGRKQVIKTAELFGTQWKIKIDSYLSATNVKAIVKKFPETEKFFTVGLGAIVDLKIMRSLERIMGKSFIEHWGYDIQTSTYSKVEAISSGKDRLPTFLSVATKEDETDIELVHIPFWRHDECLSDMEKNMPRLIAYKSGELEAPRCGTCAYCRRTKKLKAPISFENVGFSNKELALLEGKIF